MVKWQRARDVVAGEDAVKAAAELYLPRLNSQSDAEYLAYKSRASFFNATSRTLDGFLGLIFRRDPSLGLPASGSLGSEGLGRCLDDVDQMGTALFTYCKDIAAEVLAVGRAGTLVDWSDEAGLGRACLVRYLAEDILNWRVERVAGRSMVTMVVLRERVGAAEAGTRTGWTESEQIRVLFLDAVQGAMRYGVEVWKPVVAKEGGEKSWELVERRWPVRLGRGLGFIPFVFHGSRHCLPTVDRLPLGDIISVNLDHYRLDADYKHGLHFTALPTAWVSGFDKPGELKIGSTTAWVAEQAGAVAGFLEFKGHGLTTFETALAHDERQMALLGSRMLEDTKRVGETAEAISLRQAGENSVLQTLALSLSDSLTRVLRVVLWWVGGSDTIGSASGVTLGLNTDFSAQGITAAEITATVAAWQAGAISQRTMLEAFRRGELLPPYRSNEAEAELVAKGRPATAAVN